MDEGRVRPATGDNNLGRVIPGKAETTEGGMWRFVVAAAIAFAAGAVGAQTPGRPVCVAPGPTPADSERPTAMPPKPIMPKCVNPRGISRCPAAIAQAYSDQVAAYNNQARLHSTQDQAFVDHLNAWTRRAQAYVQCEVSTLNAENAGQ
jgi:hypothetical protein